MESKALMGVEIKSASEGRALVRFAAYDEVDHHGDVTQKGAFTHGSEVIVSSYNHQSWGGALPVGKATLKTRGDAAYAELQFFMNTQAGRETFETVKATGSLQQWSYGFDVKDSEHGMFDTGDGEMAVRFLKEMVVHEISPVLLGAGRSTGTLAVKSYDDGEDYDAYELSEWLKAKPKPKPKDEEEDDDKKKPGDKKPKPGEKDDEKKPSSKKPGKDEEDEEEDEEKKPPRKKPGKMRMTDHILSVLTDVKELVDRAEEIVALRKAEGKKGLAPENDVLLGLVGSELDRLKGLVDPARLRNGLDDDDDLSALIAQSLRNLSE